MARVIAIGPTPSTPGEELVTGALPRLQSARSATRSPSTKASV